MSAAAKGGGSGREKRGPVVKRAWGAEEETDAVEKERVEEWVSGTPLLSYSYRRYRDLLHVGCTLDPRAASNEKSPLELRAVGLLLRCDAS